MAKPIAKLVSMLTPKRSWFQFRLITVFIVVALICGWLSMQVHRADKQREAVAAVKASGGWVRYDFQFVQGKFDPEATSWMSGWLKPRLGDDFFHDVVEVNLVYNDDGKQRLDNRNESDEVLRHLAGFPHLKTLLLHGGQASDEGLAHVGTLLELEAIYMWDAKNVGDTGILMLASLRRLKQIHVSHSRITDESLRVFGRMSRIEQLSLQGNYFTDRGLAHLAGLVHLNELWVGWVDNERWGPAEIQITDAGMGQLEGMSELVTLDVQRSRVTNVDRLRQKLPKLNNVYR